MDFFSNTPQTWEITKSEVNLQEIQAARTRISDIVPTTPISKSIFQSNQLNRPVFFKLENFNVTGSFKIRGASNALRKTETIKLKNGVVAASAGNHAQGVAYVSKQLGIKSKIFMPSRTPMNKVVATRAYGAEVILTGEVYDDAFLAAREDVERSHGLLVHAFSDSEVINGQGTVGLEILEQIPDVGIVVIPIGGGGLAGGIGCAIKERKPNVIIIGVQTESYPAMEVALKAGTIQAISKGQSIADGIAVKRPSPRTLSLAQHYLDQVITVSEDEIAASIMSLMEKDHILAEGAGAAGVAALNKLNILIQREFQAIDGPICVVISGGNIDVNLLTRIAARGQLAAGRLMLLKVRAKDQPGQLADLLKELSKTGANLIEVRHQRTFGAMYFSDVDIEIELETVDFKHQEMIRNTLKNLGVKMEGQ